MNERDVAKFLVESGYHLTALELYTEVFERSGVAIEELSQFFEESANFLMFEDMRSVSEISAVSSESSFLNSDTLRIKDDRIAVLEHDIRVLREALEEAQSKMHREKTEISLSTPSTTLKGPPNEDEDLAVQTLINRYLQAKGLRLSALAFANETEIGKAADRVAINKDVDLIDLLRSFNLAKDTPKMADEIAQLKAENQRSQDVIAQLTVDLDCAKQEIATLKQKSKEMEAQAHTPTPTPSPSTIPEQKIVQTVEPPSVQLLDGVYSSTKELIGVIGEKNRASLIPTLRNVIRYHPSPSVRSECISMLLSLFENPTKEQRELVITTIADSQASDDRFESEVFPLLSMMLGNTNKQTLCLISTAVSRFSSKCSAPMRSTFLLSILKQLTEDSDSVVRVTAVRDCADLIKIIEANEETEEKVGEFIDMTKTFGFDTDAEVREICFGQFSPAVVDFCWRQNAIARFCDFWFNLVFTFGKTGTSSLAAQRFNACVRILAIGISKGVQDTEYSQVIMDKLLELPPLMYRPIKISKETDQLATVICESFGQTITEEVIAPKFIQMIESSEDPTKQQTTTLYISSVLSNCSPGFFIDQATNILSYATTETKGFRSADIQSFIAPGFVLLSSRSNDKHGLVFDLVNSLATSTKSSLRLVTLVLSREILPALDQNEIATKALPIVVSLASDLEESVILEAITTTGTIIRFSTNLDVIEKVKQLFDDWLKNSISKKLQVLKEFSLIVKDVEPQFRDQFIFPKVLSLANEIPNWSDKPKEDQGNTYILSTIYEAEDVSESIVSSIIGPLVSILSMSDVCSQDGKLGEIKDRYDLQTQTSKLHFLTGR